MRFSAWSLSFSSFARLKVLKRILRVAIEVLNMRQSFFAPVYPVPKIPNPNAVSFLSIFTVPSRECSDILLAREFAV